MRKLNVLQAFRADTRSRFRERYEGNAITATFFGNGCILEPFLSLDKL
jgi:hypothetical protein